MPQNGCCCSLSPTLNLCLSRCNWDQSFLDTEQKILLNRIRILKSGRRLIMDKPSSDHSYQNVNSITDTVEQKEPLRIPLGSEWDPVKIPKNLDENVKPARTLDDENAGLHVDQQQDGKSSGSEEESSKVRNSLTTVVRRACTRSPRSSNLSSPSRSPTSSFRSSQPVDTRLLEGLDALSLGATGNADLPQSCDIGNVRSSSERLYENCDVINSSPRHSNPFIEVTSSDVDSVFSSTVSDTFGISLDTRREAPDSGMSLAASDLLGSRRSCSSVGLPDNPNDLVPDSGCSGFSASRTGDEACGGTDNDVLDDLVDMYPESVYPEHIDDITILIFRNGELVKPTKKTNLQISRDRLRSCMYYVGSKSADEARDILVHCQRGTFLLRDSSHDQFKYSISVKTAQGVTSIRVGYRHHQFYLDSLEHQIHTVPKFDCVLRLIQYYVRIHRACLLPDGSIDPGVNNQNDSGVLLLHTYHRNPGSLLHLSRRAIHSSLRGRDPNRLYLIPSLKDYLNEYPSSL